MKKGSKKIHQEGLMHGGMKMLLSSLALLKTTKKGNNY